MRWITLFLLIVSLLTPGCHLRPKPAPTGTKVTIDADNIVSLNGRKLFPIGFTLGPPPDGKTPSGKNGLQELAEAGGTFMRTGARHEVWSQETILKEDRLENAAAHYGMYCWPNLRDLAVITDPHSKRAALLREVVNHFKDSPALFAWKGSDEPEWGKVPVPALVLAQKILRECDTNHPIALLEAPRGTVADLRKYAAAGDITGADVYPISYPPGKHSLGTNKEISMVGDYTKRMMDVAEGKMPVWMVLQIAWSGVVNSGTTLRMPTFPEERFMAYQAIIAGARGLIFFGGNVEAAMSPADLKLGWNWTFWNRVLHPLMEEIGTHSPLEPALIAPEAKSPVTVKNSTGVEFCVRQVGGELYILACKRAGATEKVEFENVPLHDRVGEVMFESPKHVAVKDGKFSDWFGPFEVHVYHFSGATIRP